ncbi:MAG: POTRA domain-containing protein, partial [Phycisphaerales bacterium]
MQKMILIVLTSAALSSWNLVRASTPGPEEDNKTDEPAINSGTDVIKSIKFENNRKYKDKTLRKKLDFEEGDYLDLVLVESGRGSIAEFYRTKGFAYVEVMLNRKKLSEGKVVYTIVEGPRLQVKSVRFKGNRGIKTGDLENAVRTKTRSWFFWPVYYTEEKVAADAEKLRTIYYQRGFLNHRIEVQGQTHITFVIDEGPLYKVRDIRLTGNTHFDNETLLAKLKLEPGRTYYQREAQTHVRQILKLYGESGFVDATAIQRPRFVPEPNVVDVEFKIAEGKQFRIGRVDITGNEQTQDKVVRRILDEYDFAPGRLYNADIAPKQGGGKLERYVQSSTMAEQVIIKPVTPAEGADDRKDAKVDIKEGLTGMWNPGVAVGSDSGVIGQFILQQRNFDITDWPESFGEFVTMNAFKGAGQHLRVALEPGTVVSYYSVSFTEPYLWDKPTSLYLEGSSWERWRESYDEQRTKGYVGLEKRYKSRWRGSLGFRVENVDVGDLDDDAPQEIIDVKGNNALVGTTVGIGRDFRDDILLPSKGYKFNVSYEQVTGDETFGILKGNCVGYRTLYEDLLERKTVLAMKVLAATTVSNAPPFEKFYAGGTGIYGIRGFEYRGVSTRGLQTSVASPVRKDPIGSDWIFLANTEVTVPLIGENVSALFFVDSGTIDTGRYRAAIGTGIEISIPQFLGTRVPMRFEIATPFNKDDEDETQVFSF